MRKGGATASGHRASSSNTLPFLPQAGTSGNANKTNCRSCHPGQCARIPSFVSRRAQL